MFAWENGVVPNGRIKRESGSWGFMVVYKSYGSEEEILVNECGTFPPDEEAVMADQVGSTGMSCGTTINMGNYESARVDCWCSLPCTEESVEEQHKKCYDFVTKKVEEFSRAKVEATKG